MQINWLEVLSTVFELVIFPVLSAATIYFITWLKAKKQELLKKAKDETTKKYIEILDKTITECVLATSQTYVDALKKEGKFDAEAQKKALQMSFDAVMAILTDDVQEHLGDVIKDLGIYITNKIEAQIKASKS
jgi:hypothetical protein